MWKCANCNEESEDNFDSCWNCQTKQGQLITKDSQSMTPVCPKCQSSRIIPDVRILDHNYSVTGDLSVEIYESPNALLFKGAHQGKLQAKVCGWCGYTELYVENPGALYNIYQQSIKR